MWRIPEGARSVVALPASQDMLKVPVMARVDRAVARSAKWVKRHAVAAFALLLALVVVSGALRSGASFVYCEMMQSFLPEPCCALHDHAGAASGDQAELGVSHIECCTPGTLPVVPSAEIVRLPATPHAPLLAVVPVIRHVDVLAVSGEEPCAESFRRAEPIGPPSHSESRARLMVFLT